METQDIEKKFVGCMVGSAIGDAIGEVAFMVPERDALYSELDRLSRLTYTDDTAMAIGLAESILETKGIDPRHLGDTFKKNFNREPWRGYASGPPAIFSMMERGNITYPEAAKTLFLGQGSLGNGAAMRVAPAGLFLWDSPHLYEQVCATAEVTHAHPVGMDGAAVQACAVSEAVKLEPEKEFPSEIFMAELAKCARTREIREKMRLVQSLITRNAPPHHAASKLGRTVAVHESMPFAIYAFVRHPASFEQCLLCAILNGGDRDTLGAMAGAVSGAYLGIDALSENWQEKLENREYIASLASRLAELVSR